MPAIWKTKYTTFVGFMFFLLNILCKFKMPYKNHEHYNLHEIIITRFSEKKRRKEGDKKGQEHFRFDKF